MPAAERAARRSADPAEPARLRVLLVEDETLVRTTTAEMLAGLDHEVLEAATAEEALDQLDNAVDLVITDIGLPGTDGLALAARARRRDPALPVIVATGRLPSGDTSGLVWWPNPTTTRRCRPRLPKRPSRRRLRRSPA